MSQSRGPAAARRQSGLAISPEGSALLDLARGAVQNGGNAAHLIGGQRAPPEPDHQRGLEIAHRSADFRCRAAGVGMADLGHAREDLVDHRLVGGKERRPFGCDAELFARPLGAIRSDVAELLEQGRVG